MSSGSLAFSSSYSGSSQSLSTMSLSGNERGQSSLILADFTTERHKTHWSRLVLHDVISRSTFNNWLLAIIIMNTIVLAIQSVRFTKTNYDWYLAIIDQTFLGLYIMEFAIKLYVLHLGYFRSAWNVFDLLIVCSSVITFMLPVFLTSSSGFSPSTIRLIRVFRALRALRSLRALRTITFFRSLHVLVETLLRSLPAISSIVALSILVLYIFAVLARALYGELDPERFGSIGRAIFWTFGILTYESWTSIWHDHRNEDNTIFVFLFVFVILEGFVLLNLFVAVICSNMDELQKRSEKERKRQKKRRELGFFDSMDALTRQNTLSRPDASGRTDLMEGKADTLLRKASFVAGKETIKSFASSSQAQPLSSGQQQEIAIRTALNDGDGFFNYYPANSAIGDFTLYSDALSLLPSLEHSVNAYERQHFLLDQLIDVMETPGALGVRANANAQQNNEVQSTPVLLPPLGAPIASESEAITDASGAGSPLAATRVPGEERTEGASSGDGNPVQNSGSGSPEPPPLNTAELFTFP